MKAILLISLAFSVFAADLCDHRVFNWNFYLSHNKRLMRSGYNDANAACRHWRASGANEGLQAHPRFHTRQYCDNYVDLRSNGYCNPGHFSNAVNHYLDNGYKEGRKGFNVAGKYGTWTVTNGLFTMLASEIHGGSISSLVYKDTIETVNSYDRGRQLQFAFSDASGENNNPTEGGSEKDGIADRSTTRLIGARAGDNYIATTCQPALWRGGLSNFRVSKQVTLNIGGNKHLMSFDLSFSMAKTYGMVALECPTLYMPTGFTKAYVINVKSKTYSAVALPKGLKPDYTSKPVMYSNGEVAIGTREVRKSGLPNGSLLYAYFGVLSRTHQIDITTKWSAWYHNNAKVVTGTKISTLVYVAVGTLSEVTQALSF